MLQPLFRGNCLNWVLGHIVFRRAGVLTTLGEMLPWNEADAARYQRNADPVTNAEQALPLEQLLAALEESQSRLTAGFAHVSAEHLEARTGEETHAERLAFSNWHVTYHVGQLGLYGNLQGRTIR